MAKQQSTILQEVSLSGIGLHTGKQCQLTFKPAPENTGIIFVRTDIEGRPEVPALIDYIKEDHTTSSLRGTNIEKDGVTIYTVEHVMASLAGLQIDNCYVELNESEPPIMDGSGIEFVKVLKKAGIIEQNALRKYAVIKDYFNFKNDDQDTEIVVLPSNEFRITVMIDYKNPALGSQHTGMFDMVEEFEKEFAPARTFCFLNEVEYLYSQGLIKGGSTENAIVIADKNMTKEQLKKLGEMLNVKEELFIGDNGMINGIKLRFPNEPCRHKAFDLLGDLYLIGAPIKGHILAARPGHQSNIVIAKKIREIYKNQLIQEKYQGGATKDLIFDVNAIKRILPHRYPLLLVDKIIEYEAGKRIVGVKNVSANEQIFNGHFPDKPIFPGVLICEAMAQTGGIMFLNMIENPEEKLVYFMSMNNVKFRQPVIPGDQVIMEVEMIKQRRNTSQIKGTARVDGNLVCEGEFVAVTVDRNTNGD
ncbi:MAG: bifunctional UDP-3-O-[3-hydroxymyristoyl] N-acetylglucosamine deacetylase/3-hydroxyacyl-ACP dehydratase [Calditrichaeota bacterium]|nr:bifunctional UDP-3-O-[3-hydroxymyristoyl] N-acetylglucosamine deacetylase/3-hydroxyacyl-ACP dehydratase [Calditrichota bacterium]